MFKKIVLVVAMLASIGFSLTVLALPADCEDCLIWRTKMGQSCAAAISFCEVRYPWGSCPTTCL